MRILVVEDHRDSLEAMYRLLAFHHHDVTPARTLKDAVRLCIKDKFDLVVCDIGLPDGDGWELARVARECGWSMNHRGPLFLERQSAQHVLSS